MSVFKALAATESQNKQGWSFSNSYNHSNSPNVDNNQQSPSSSHSTPQHQASFSMSIAGPGSGNSRHNNQQPPSSSHSTPQHQASFSMSTAGTGSGNSHPQEMKDSDMENEARLMEEFEGDSDEFDGDPEDFDFEGYPEDFEDYPGDFNPEHFEGGQGHFEGTHRHFEGSHGHFEDGQEHFEGDQAEFEDDQEPFEDDQEHFEDGQEHFEDGQEPFEGDQEDFEDGQEHFEGGQEHFEDGQGPFEGDQRHFKSGQEHFHGGQGHFQGGQRHFQGGQRLFLGGQRHFQGTNQEQIEGCQGPFEGDQEHFEHYEDYDEDFDCEDFEDEDEDFDFEGEEGELILPHGHTKSSSGFQNSYNNYIMSQYHSSGDVQTDYDDHSQDAPTDFDHGPEQAQFKDQPGNMDNPSQKEKTLQLDQPAPQEPQMRLPLRVHEGHEFSPSSSHSAESPSRQQTVDQKCSGSNHSQQDGMRMDQQPHHQNPKQPVSQGHSQHAERVTTQQAKPHSQKPHRQSVSEVTVTSHNVTVSSYNHQPKNRSGPVPRHQQSFLRMPNPHTNIPNQYHPLPRHGTKGQRFQGVKRGWHMPQQGQPRHPHPHGRQQQYVTPAVSKYPNVCEEYEEEEEYYMSQQEQPPRLRFPHHSPQVFMRGSPRPPKLTPRPDLLYAPKKLRQGSSAAECSSQALVPRCPEKPARNSSQVSGQHSSPVPQRQSMPQTKQNPPHLLAGDGSVPTSSCSQQRETGQGGEKQLHEQNALRREMQKLFNLPSKPKVIMQGGRRAQGLQHNTYYSVQRCTASSTGRSATILYSGADKKKFLCSEIEASQEPVKGGPQPAQAQQRVNNIDQEKRTGGSGGQGPASGSTPSNHRSDQGGPVTSTTPKTGADTAHSTTTTTTASTIECPADSSTTSTASDRAGVRMTADSVNRQAAESFANKHMNEHMNGGFPLEMMEFDEEDFDEDEEDFDEEDEEYYDEEEELEHDAVMRELEMEEMEEMGSHSPPPLPVGVPRPPAPKGIWPNPLPSMNQRKEKAESGSKPTRVEFVSSSNQQACSSPVFGFSPGCVLQECKPSSPGPGQDSKLMSLEPVQLANPVHPELKGQEGCPKRPLADDEEGTALCKCCGFCSKNLDTCEACNRNFPPNVKVFIKKRKLGETPDKVFDRERTCGGGKVNPSPSDAGLSMDKKMFYGNKGESFMDSEEEFEDNFVIKNTERTHSRLHGNRASSLNPRKIFKGVKEPVTVTISSDEDEDPSSESGQQNASKPATVKPVSVTSATVTNATSSSMTATSAAAAAPTSTTTTTQDNDEGFFSPVSTKPTSNFGTLRRLKMEDAAGRCKQKPQSPVPQKPRSPIMRFVGEGIYFNVRGVRVGSMRTSGLEVRFMTRSIAFTVISDRTQEELDFFVYVSDIQSIAFTLKQPQPVAFLKVIPGCGVRLRSHLKMVEGSPDYFDPGSDDPQKNMIVIIIEMMTDEQGLRQMLRSYSKTRKIRNFLTELDYDAANDLLVSSTPPTLASHASSTVENLPPLEDEEPCTPSPTSRSVCDEGDASRLGAEEEEEEEEEGMNMQLPMAGDASMYPPEDYEGYDEYEEEEGCTSSPYYGFVGPVEKLLTYPPPPAKGGITITTEDLFCLNEGEFLNDVILDFYLKYIFLKKLSEEDRKRTHIFSSFFFKRLTQKQARSSQDQEEVKQTIQERRHSRVRTWTRQVDIFSKDFLLIPINENAHWFLAIVCFPSLTKEEYVSFQPTQLSEEEQPPPPPPPPEQSGNSESSESTPTRQSEKKEEGEGGEEEEDPDNDSDTASSSSPKEDCVLGKVIPSETALQGQPGDYKLGLKQPCILVMDSLMGPSRNAIIKILKEYLQVEWDLKKGTPHDMMKNVRGGCPLVPQQNNFSDCGVFVLQYAESFFSNPIANFALPMKLEQWFPMGLMERKREEIHDLILRLQDEVNNR